MLSFDERVHFRIYQAGFFLEEAFALGNMHQKWPIFS
jgi:hypothetical protein